MIQAITNFTTKISFKNIFGPIIKRILKIFFSDRRTANILRILGSFFGLFRFLNASLGFLIFLNVFDFKNFSFYSIPSSIISFLHLLKSNFEEVMDKYYPNHPHIPENVKTTFNDSVEKISEVIHDNPSVSGVIDKIHNEVDKNNTEVDGKFSSLRKLYSDYVNKWFTTTPTNETPEIITDHYNLFTDWKFYVGAVIIAGVLYFVVASIISHFRGNNSDFNTPLRGSNPNLDTPGNVYHPETPSKTFFSNYWERFYNFVKKVSGNDGNSISPSDFPDAPIHTPVSKSRFPWFSNLFTPKSPLQGKGKHRIQDEESLTLSTFSPKDGPGYSTIALAGTSSSDPYSGVRSEISQRIVKVEIADSINYDNESVVWDEIYRSQGENKVKNIINTLSNNISDNISEVGSDITPDLTNDSESVADTIDSVYDWGDSVWS